MTDIYQEQLAEGERVEFVIKPTETVYRVEFYCNGGWWSPVRASLTRNAEFEDYDEAEAAALEFHKRRPNLPVRVISRNIEVPS